jgi:cytochrome c biogenesis protein CcdA
MAYLILVAFLAGIISVLTPCVLPLIPAVMAGSIGDRLRPIAIVLGMSITFSLMGVVTSKIGGTVATYTSFLRDLATFIIIFLGLLLVSEKLNEKFVLTAGVIMNKLGSIEIKEGVGTGKIGGFILGLSLGIVWIPCVGPILGSVLTAVALKGDVLTGGLSLFSYSLGIGIPMLIVAYTGKLTFSRMRSVAKHGETIKKIAGVLLILTGISIFLGLDRQIQIWLLPYFPEIVV